MERKRRSLLGETLHKSLAVELRVPANEHRIVARDDGVDLRPRQP